MFRGVTLPARTHQATHPVSLHSLRGLIPGFRINAVFRSRGERTQTHSGEPRALHLLDLASAEHLRWPGEPPSNQPTKHPHRVDSVLSGWLPSGGQSGHMDAFPLSYRPQLEPQVLSLSQRCDSHPGCGRGYKEAKGNRNMSTGFWGSCQHKTSTTPGYFFLLLQRDYLKNFTLMQHVIFSGSHL